MEDQKPAKRKYTKRRMTLNDKVASFRLKTDPTHRRVIHCYQVDDTGDLWCVHYRTLVPGKKYTRTFSEWFEKAKWDYIHPDLSKAKKSRHIKIGKSMDERLLEKAQAPKEPEPLPVEEPPVPAKTALEAAMERLEALERRLEEKAKSAPAPRIMFEEESRSTPVGVRLPADDTPSEEEDEVTVSVNPVTNLRVVRKKGQDTPNDEIKKNGKSVEYNRFAHKEMALGKPEDLAMFEAHVQSNAAMNIGRAKLMQQRHKRDLLAQLEKGNLGSGAGFTPDGTDA